MFRRLPNQLPKDAIFPTDLKGLGYFINDNDQIRQIANPEHKYQYKVNRNDRVNEVYKEAMNTCARSIVLKRLLDLGLEEVRLPLGTAQSEKHVSILVSPGLASKKHVIIFFPERHTDLGVLSYRVIGDEGINIGSIVNFVKSILKGPPSPAEVTTNGNTTDTDDVQAQVERPGIVIANPSQLIWYRGGGRAVTDREWLCMPRESAVHEPMRIDEVKNRVEGNKNFEEHVQYIFEHILSSEDDKQPLCHPQAKISVIGQEYPGSEALQYITKNWMGWRNRISCVALINPQHGLEGLFSTFDLSAPGDAAEKEQVTDFIATRTRAYKLSHKPLETVMSGRTRLGCNVYSSGETLYEEAAFVRCWPSVLDWIDVCRFSDTFAEPVFEMELSDEEEEQGWKEKPKTRSPRRPQTEEEQLEARFRGELKVTEEGAIADA
ncbi:hypothetical protein PMZ80_008894 [Knufia obscura]|uniref:Arb2 domain-containing protein n=1 Tax=Knufia obscura TaxID=1635080 RepID=A0ABR0RDI7_9EURO|nr:hypothetical protein PMZ80_008894 [Knufia obscura]